jgi:hypothetical protein
MKYTVGNKFVKINSDWWNWLILIINMKGNNNTFEGKEDDKEGNV